ncbi:MAG: serine hydrolase domain-containing protein [Bacteroidota bacterium]|nr:beta-lactamase family protein [Rhodothermia bacterium]MCS7156000.1 beta-lactamase family protein [Bacteroidota bacterium]MDW8137817.1 serine hydrolase domain-containing protein [Bacteroidota bacterium]MDW8286332.1 serine hydrolase domain-containing protein [Bacteroidota bacterium]
MLKRVLALLFLLGVAFRVSAQQALPLAQAPAVEGRFAPVIERARDSLLALMRDRAIPGLQVAVAIRGRIVWSEGFGWADLENRVPVWPSTRFRVASVSKALTSAALGLLWEQGRLDLDAEVQRYVPSFPRKRWPITVRQVAGHLAGIRHYRGQEFLSSRRYRSVLEALSVFQDDSLLFEPGTRYSYSSYGWNLLSAVIEGASGEEFLGLMRRRVFEPLGMRYTVAEHTDSLILGRARFYVRDSLGRILNAPYVDNSVKWAGGGFLSTAEDLVRFGSGLLEGRLLRPQTVELLFSSQRTRDGRPTGYGIGWSTGERAGRRTVWHTGGAVGGSAILLLRPETSVVVALIANMQNAGLAGAGFQLAVWFEEALR